MRITDESQLLELSLVAQTQFHFFIDFAFFGKRLF